MEQCTLFVLGSQYVLFIPAVLSVFNPQCPKLNSRCPNLNGPFVYLSRMREQIEIEVLSATCLARF